MKPAKATGLFLMALSLFAQAPQKPLRERLLERALKGDVDAQFDLGKNYEAGRIGLKKDMVQAEHWYREAANQGEPFAQASLGILYGFGKGIPADLVQALMWYELATEHTTGGDRDTIAEMRDDLAARMTPQQVAEARKLAHDWKPEAKRP
jgi:TPR repeat protein